MKLNREALLRAVETVKPGLATRELIEELTCCWFDGKTATAYNDASLGIQVPFQGELVGGIRGSILLGVLTHSRAREVEVDSPADGEAILKCGRTKLRLSLLAPDRAVWEFPSLGKAKGHKLSKPVLEALKAVLIATAPNSAAPEQTGVTLIHAKDQLHMFTINDRCVAHSTTKDTWELKKNYKVTIPSTFVDQLLKLADAKSELYLLDDAVVLVTGDYVKLYARLVDVAKPTDFFSLTADLTKKAEFFPTPPRLKLALERASIMLNGQNSSAVSVKVEDDKLTLHAKAPYGELRDSIKLDKKVPAASVRAEPELLKQGLPLTDKMAVTVASILMSGKNFNYFTAPYEDKST